MSRHTQVVEDPRVDVVDERLHRRTDGVLRPCRAAAPRRPAGRRARPRPTAPLRGSSSPARRTGHRAGTRPRKGGTRRRSGGRRTTRPPPSCRSGARGRADHHPSPRRRHRSGRRRWRSRPAVVRLGAVDVDTETLAGRSSCSTPTRSRRRGGKSASLSVVSGSASSERRNSRLETGAFSTSGACARTGKARRRTSSGRAKRMATGVSEARHNVRMMRQKPRHFRHGPLPSPTAVDPDLTGTHRAAHPAEPPSRGTTRGSVRDRSAGTLYPSSPQPRVCVAYATGSPIGTATARSCRIR